MLQTPLTVSEKEGKKVQSKKNTAHMQREERVKINVNIRIHKHI